MQAREERTWTKQSLDVINVKRNPYLVDYEEQKRLRRAANVSPRRISESAARGRRPSGTASGRNRRSVEVIDTRSRRTSRVREERSYESLDLIDIGVRQRTSGKAGMKRSRENSSRRGLQSSNFHSAGCASSGRFCHTGNDVSCMTKNMAKKRRRKRLIRRKITAAAVILCLFMIGWLFMLKKGMASELEYNGGGQGILESLEEELSTSSVNTQGISSKQFAKHPAWTEDLLPMNEYSRPGETLPEVKDIFVHYTANPGTSAAQNRSYFEQQKDMHEASVSAHFIIGYEGEIIQCVPLNEIAYAVQTRNYDSVSIECCYKAEDGSFTKETYDSLLSLLAWLTDTYDLDTSHILRHYDCGGKKCPLYYTEHEEAWEQLKADVGALQGK